MSTGSSGPAVNTRRSHDLLRRRIYAVASKRKETLPPAAAGRSPICGWKHGLSYSADVGTLGTFDVSRHTAELLDSQ